MEVAMDFMTLEKRLRDLGIDLQGNTAAAIEIDRYKEAAVAKERSRCAFIAMSCAKQVWEGIAAGSECPKCGSIEPRIDCIYCGYGPAR
jgi:hypothetical protein